MNTKKLTRQFLIVSLGALLLSITAMPAQRNESPEMLLQRGIQSELVDGDIQSAIDLYRRVVTASGVKPAVAARALVRMGQSYEKLADGSSEARKAYERVVREFGNQAEAAAEAQAHLKAMAVPPQAPQVEFKGLTRISSKGYPVPWSAITPDGRHLLAGEYGFTMRDLVTGEEKSVEGERTNTSEGWVYEAGGVALSPDGKQMAYTFEFLNGPDLNLTELRVLPVNGPKGVRPKTLVRNPEIKVGPFGWSPDSKDIFALVTREDGTIQIGAVSAVNGALRTIKSLDWRWPEKLSVSPDGKYIVYDAPVERDSWNRDIFLIATDGSMETALVHDASRDALPLWTPDGNAVVFLSDRLGTLGVWMLRVSGGKPDGIPQLLRRSMGSLFPIAFTRDGVLLYRSDNPQPKDVYIAEVDLDAGAVTRQPERMTGGMPGQNFASAYSPDGKELVYFSQRGAGFPGRYGLNGQLSLVVRSLETGQERAFPTPYTSVGQPSWFPDRRSVAFVAQASVHRIDLATGEEMIRQKVETDNRLHITPVSPDSKRIYFRRIDDVKKGGNQLLMAYEVDTGREVLVTDGLTRGGEIALSPDGRNVLFQVRRNDPQRVTLVAMPSTGGQHAELKVPAIQGGTNFRPIRWSGDGKELLVQLPSTELWWLAIDGSQGRKVGAVRYPAIDSMHPGGRLVTTSQPSVAPTPIAGGPLAGLGDNRQFWMDPDLLPDRGHGIFVVEVDPNTARVRGNVVRTTQGLIHRETTPSFSPDGKSIAFLRPRPNDAGVFSNDLVVRSLATGTESTYAVAAQGWPKWLRDGDSILFPRQSSGLHRMGLRGGQLTNLGEEFRKANPPDYQRNSSVLSPDNKTLYFSARLSSGTVTVPDRIVAIDMTTWKQREIFVVPAVNGIRPHIAISPDGRTLAIVTEDDRSTGNGQLIRVGVDGSGYTVLYSAPGLYYPVFTKDGRGILVGQWDANKPLAQILRVPVAGGKAEFTGLEVEEHFDLSPDGTRIAFDGGSYRISQAGSR